LVHEVAIVADCEIRGECDYSSIYKNIYYISQYIKRWGIGHGALGIGIKNLLKKSPPFVRGVGGILLILRLISSTPILVAT
jgi:hypothetical protein